MTVNMILIGNRIREARERVGLSMEKAAELSGISRSTFAEVERGKRLPRLGTLCIISAALGMSADWLLGLTDDPRTPPRAPADEERRAMMLWLEKTGRGGERGGG